MADGLTFMAATTDGVGRRVAAALGAGGASWPLKADLYSPSAAIAASMA